MGRIVAIIAMIFLALMAIGKCAGPRQGQTPTGAPTDGARSINGPDNLASGSVSGRLWVTTPRLERRTCPSETCGVVGQLFFREAATVLERSGGWARITRPYDAGCQGGRSDYVDRGNAACTPENGMIDGRFAEWVRAESLSETRPPDPAATASQTERLVAQSDDFGQYRAAFVRAANELIQSGRCTAGDLEEQGGWVKSSNHPDEPVYFTYCDGMTIANRIYLNAETGRIF